MSTIKNSITLIGHLGRDPEIKTYDSGSKAARFSMATSETYVNAKGEKVTDTQWHNCVAWDKLGEEASTTLKKGKEVVVRGKLVHRNYEDKEGIKRTYSEIVVNEFTLVAAEQVAQ